MPVDETEDSYRVRVRMPNEFQEGSFRTIDIDKDRKIKAVIGRLREDPEHPTATQSFIFSKENPYWTKETAEKWVRDHGETPKSLLTFMLGLKAEDYHCECLSCGYEMTSPVHCKDIACPKCGGTMRRAERPGMGQEVYLDFDIISQKSAGSDLVLEGWASTNAVDREGEAIEIETMDLDDFKQNPILLYQHDPEKPIGKVTHFRKEQDQDGKWRLWVKAVVHGSTSLGKEIIRLIKAGVLRAFSVGGKSQKKTRRGGVTWLRGMKLLELSIVSIPANPEALFQTSKELGDLIVQVPELAVAKSIGIGLARNEAEARLLLAMDLAVQKHITLNNTPMEESNMEETTQAATAAGGQETMQETPAIPEELMQRLEALEAKVAAIEQAMAAATEEAQPTEAAATVETTESAAEPQNDSEEAPTTVLLVEGEKKGHVLGGQRVQKDLDIKNMKPEDRKALAHMAFEETQG
jgi:HK97 family phage prohead protease